MYSNVYRLVSKLWSFRKLNLHKFFKSDTVNGIHFSALDLVSLTFSLAGSSFKKSWKIATGSACKLSWQTQNLLVKVSYSE